MSMWHISFNVEGKALGDTLEAVHRYRVQDLDLRPLVRKGATGKAGAIPAWQVVAEAVAAHKGPMRAKVAGPALEAAGYSKGGVSTHLANCLRRGAIKKTSKGYVKGNERRVIMRGKGGET